MMSSSEVAVSKSPHQTENKIQIMAENSTDPVNEVTDSLQNFTIGGVEAESTPKPTLPTQAELEREQLESNEDSTRSEDMQQFLKEMHEKLTESNQEQQQQAALNAGLVPVQMMTVRPGLVQPTDISAMHTSASQYSLMAMNATGVPTAGAYETAEYVPSNQPNIPVLPATVQGYVDQPAPDSPPDGGWGWIVVIGSFCCMILVDGVCFSYGLLLTPQCPYASFKAVDINQNVNASPSIWPTRYSHTTQDRRSPPVGSCVPISELGESLNTQYRSALLTPGALLVGIYLLLGPLVSALTNQFDFRSVAMIGSALSTIAFFSSAFTNSIAGLMLTFGVLGGIGFSFIYLPAIATVGHWFQHKRPLAVGLALCGSGVGCVLGAQALIRLVQWSTWRGALVILAAASLQSMVLIALFRPLDVHFQLEQIQREKRKIREESRKAAALRRAEMQRWLIEAQHKKRMAAAAAAVQATGHKRHVYDLNTFSMHGVSSSAAQGRALQGVHPKYGHGLVSWTMATQPGGRPVIVGGGKQFSVAPTATGRHPILIGFNHVLSDAPGAAELAAMTRGRQLSGRSSRVKRASNRRLVVYRGTIMQRIIEEKRRQRTTSVGSLDGMVITRDNELIAAPQVGNYDRPLISASTIQRIAEAVTRKYESKLASQQQLLQQSRLPMSSGATAGVSASSGAAGSKMGLSRSQIRTSFPQLVQEYIQSQMSVSVIQPPSKLPVATHQPTHFDGSMTDTAVFSHLSEQPYISGQPGPAFPATSILTQTSFNQPQISVDLTTGVSSVTPVPKIQGAPGCDSEFASDGSLCSSIQHVVTGAGRPNTVFVGPSGTTVDGMDCLVPGSEQLDNEIKAEIQLRLKRELSRPQYKKDLFFTGSVQLGSSFVGDAADCGPSQVFDAVAVIPGSAADRSSIISGAPLVPSTAAVYGSRVQVMRVAPIQQPTDTVSELQGSQTNLSVAASTGVVATTFIPPAPCPAPVSAGPIPSGVSPIVPLPTVLSIPPDHVSMVATDLHHSSMAQKQDEPDSNQCSPGSLPEVNQQPLQAKPSEEVPSFVHQQSIAADDVEAVYLDGPDDLNELDVEDIDVDDDAEDDGDDVDFRTTYRFRDKLFCCCGNPFTISYAPMQAFLIELLSPWILLSPVFVFMLLSSTMTMLGLIVPFLMLPDLLTELNWRLDDCGLMISWIGVGNTVGRLIATVYIDKAWSTVYGWADCLWVNNGSLLLSSFMVLLMPLLRSYYTAFFLTCILFGLSSAAFVSLRSILVVELLGLERLTNAFGYMLLFQGAAASIGPPLAGFLRDWKLQSYPPHNIMLAHQAPVHNSSAVGFYFAAGCLFLACLFAAPLRFLAKREGNAGDFKDGQQPAPAMLMMQPHDYDFHAQHYTDQLTDSVAIDPAAAAASAAVTSGWMGMTNPAASFSDNISATGGVAIADTQDTGLMYTTNQTVDARFQQSSQFVPSPVPLQVLGVTNTSAIPSTPSGCPTLPVSVVSQLPIVSSNTDNPIGILDLTNPITVSGTSVVAPTAGDASIVDTIKTSVPEENIAVFDGLVGAIVLPASAVSCANNGASIALTSPAQAIEVLGVKEEPGLEPVVEEEEEDDDEEDYDEEETEIRYIIGSDQHTATTNITSSSAGMNSSSLSTPQSPQSSSGNYDGQNSVAKKWKRKKRKMPPRVDGNPLSSGSTFDASSTEANISDG